VIVFLAPEEVHPMVTTAWEICFRPPYEVHRIMVTRHDSFVLIIDVTQQNLFCLLKIRYN
jgi:hypothetical protein